MVDLSLTFTFCQHCQNRTMEPRNVCPACDWPRSHTDKTPAPSFGCPDPNAQFVHGKMPVIQQHLADIKLESVEFVPPAPPAAPMNEAAIPDLGVMVTATTKRVSSKEKLRTLTLAPEDPIEEAE